MSATVLKRPTAVQFGPLQISRTKEAEIPKQVNAAVHVTTHM